MAVEWGLFIRAQKKFCPKTSPPFAYRVGHLGGPMAASSVNLHGPTAWEEADWASLYTAAFLYAIVLIPNRGMVDAADAEDLASAAILELFLSPPKCPDDVDVDDFLRRYLFGILRHRVIDKVRRDRVLDKFRNHARVHTHLFDPNQSSPMEDR